MNHAAVPFAVALLPLLSCTPTKSASVGSANPAQRAQSSTPKAASWTRIDPAGNTTCSDGSDFAFFARLKDPSKLLVFFQGGGACWSGRTCSADRMGTFRPTIAKADPANGKGIFDLDHGENPFADYSVVYVPYCTGDLHLGDSDVTYDVAKAGPNAKLKPGQNPAAHRVTIRHRGHNNATSALDWTFEHVPAPTSIFVAGISAGAVPAPYYATHLADHYPDAQIATLGDGAGGYQLKKSGATFDRWKTASVLDHHPAYADLTSETLTYEQLYITAAQAHPDAVFARVDNAEDRMQKSFLAMSGNKTSELLPFIDANHAIIRKEVDNYRSYVASGKRHTILGLPEVYSVASGGVRLIDWLTGLVDGTPVEDAHCGDRCGETP